MERFQNMKINIRYCTMMGLSVFTSIKHHELEERNVKLICEITKNAY